MSQTLIDQLAGPPPVEDPDQARPISHQLHGSDRTFRGVARLSAIIVLTIMGFIGVFLAYRGFEALRRDGIWKFITTQAWFPEANHFGIAAVIPNGIFIALVAIVFAIPLAVGTALYISEYAPGRVRSTLIAMVDLMAAVPSVVYGIWGLFLFQGHAANFARWIATYFSWIPIFKVTGFNPHDPLGTITLFTSSSFIAGMVVGLMITPSICSISREVFTRAPDGEREGALALGATKWGMIRSVVLPYGRGGVIGGTMLGLGRALGETIAVVLIISPIYFRNAQILHNGTNSVSALIANKYGEASSFATSALMAAGLSLFLLTLAVNFGASSIVARSRSGASGDA